MIIFQCSCPLIRLCGNRNPLLICLLTLISLIKSQQSCSTSRKGTRRKKRGREKERREIEAEGEKGEIERRWEWSRNVLGNGALFTQPTVIPDIFITFHDSEPSSTKRWDRPPPHPVPFSLVFIVYAINPMMLTKIQPWLYGTSLKRSFWL